MDKFKILIVEDEIVASQYLKLILKNLGYKLIYEVNNAKKALELVKKEKIDLVFMDINIDGSIDGISCAHIINKEYFLPVIFTTAYADSQTIIDATDTNIFGYLIKPFELHDVEATLLVALKRIKIHTNNKLNLKENIDDDIINLGSNQSFNFTKNAFYINNQIVDLTKKELHILNIMSKNRDHNTTFEILKKEVWNNRPISNSTIRDTVSRLRKKASNLNIQSLSGIGYILKVSSAS